MFTICYLNDNSKESCMALGFSYTTFQEFWRLDWTLKECKVNSLGSE